jgi:uncharacterized protein
MSIIRVDVNHFMIKEYTPEQFKNAFGVEYLSHLEFKQEKILKKIQKRVKRADERGDIETRQRWLGAFYAEEIRKGRVPDLVIEWINAEIGYGVFAGSAIPKGTYIGEYTGIVRKRRFFSDKKNGYCFEYNIGDGLKSPFVIDAQPKGNHTRFINHGDSPNLEPACVICDGLMHIVLFAIEPISKGTQLSYDYGEDYWSKRQKIKRTI